MNLRHGEIHFAVGVLFNAATNETQIKRGLSAFGGDFQHVVHPWVDFAALDLLDAFDQALDEALQLRRRRSAHGNRPPLVELRYWQLQHVGCLHVCDLPKLGHQFGHVDKPGEAALQSVAGAVWTQFHRCDGFTERPCP